MRATVPASSGRSGSVSRNSRTNAASTPGGLWGGAEIAGAVRDHGGPGARGLDRGARGRAREGRPARATGVAGRRAIAIGRGGADRALARRQAGLLAGGL